MSISIIKNCALTQITDVPKCHHCQNSCPPHPNNPHSCHSYTPPCHHDQSPQLSTIWYLGTTPMSTIGVMVSQASVTCQWPYFQPPSTPSTLTYHWFNRSVYLQPTVINHLHLGLTSAVISGRKCCSPTYDNKDSYVEIRTTFPNCSGKVTIRATEASNPSSMFILHGG